MKKKLIAVLIVLATVVGIAFAQNNACVEYKNGYGLSVFVDSKKDTNDTDYTIIDYINKITVTSNGNKMRITSVKIKKGNGKMETIKNCPILGKIIEPYGEIQFTYKTHGKELKAEDVEIKAEGCN